MSDPQEQEKDTKKKKVKEVNSVVNETQESILNQIPVESIKHYGIAPLSFKDGTLEIGMLDPDDIKARDALNFLASGLGVSYTVKKITEEEFNKKVDEKKLDAGSEGVEEALQDLDLDEFSSNVSLGRVDEMFKDDGEVLEDEAPIIRIVASMVKKATTSGASDVHIDPSTADSVVRFRIDGTLVQVYKIPKKIHGAIVTRIKILSNLRLDERRRPLDSRFSSRIGGARVDFRVATFPTTNGEKIVLRVLNQASVNKGVQEIGLASLAERNLREAVEKPHGLILATGPTGSGKTVTIYSLLGLINKEKKNVVSLEDPVEIIVDSIAQSQIFPEIGYTFASGLRSILRGDPDVIFVGEIRDKETAALAVQSALTGHLVFSTLHTNTAIGAIARLKDFGIEPFFLAPTLRMVIGQRLVKTFHEGKGKPVPLSPEIKKKFEDNFSSLPDKYKQEFPTFDTHYLPEPTDEVPDGLKGRVGVFEVLNVNENISEAILADKNESEIFQLARNDGYTTMEEDAFLKSVSGAIPLAEVARISGDSVLAGAGDKEYEEDEMGEQDEEKQGEEVQGGSRVSPEISL